MRKFAIAGAAAFLAISGPAKATYYSNLSIGASIDVTRTTFQCLITDPACSAAYPSGTAYSSFALPFSYPILHGLDIVEGDNFFFQQFSARGSVSGYIVIWAAYLLGATYIIQMIAAHASVCVSGTTTKLVRRGHFSWLVAFLSQPLGQ